MLVMPHLAGLAGADVGQVGTRAHGAEEHGIFAHVVAGHGGTRTPAALEIAAVADLADLLAMTINTTCRGVDLLAPFGQTGERRRIDIARFLVGHRREAPQCKIGIGDQSEPGTQEGQENPDNEDRHPVHTLSGSGWRPWSLPNSVGSVRRDPALSRSRVKLTAKTIWPAVRSTPETLRRNSHGLV